MGDLIQFPINRTKSKYQYTLPENWNEAGNPTMPELINTCKTLSILEEEAELGLKNARSAASSLHYERQIKVIQKMRMICYSYFRDE